MWIAVTSFAPTRPVRAASSESPARVRPNAVTIASSSSGIGASTRTRIFILLESCSCEPGVGPVDPRGLCAIDEDVHRMEVAVAQNWFRNVESRHQSRDGREAGLELRVRQSIEHEPDETQPPLDHRPLATGCPAWVRKAVQ